MTLPICAGCELRTDPADLNGLDHCPSCAPWECEQCGRLDCSCPPEPEGRCCSSPNCPCAYKPMGLGFASTYRRWSA